MTIIMALHPGFHDSSTTKWKERPRIGVTQKSECPVRFQAGCATADRLEFWLQKVSQETLELLDGAWMLLQEWETLDFIFSQEVCMFKIKKKRRRTRPGGHDLAGSLQAQALGQKLCAWALGSGNAGPGSASIRETRRPSSCQHGAPFLSLARRGRLGPHLQTHLSQ